MVIYLCAKFVDSKGLSGMVVFDTWIFKSLLWARMNRWRDWNDDLGKGMWNFEDENRLEQSWVLKRAKRSSIPVQFKMQRICKVSTRGKCMVPLKRPESYPSRDPNPCMRREHSRIPIYPKSQRPCKWGGRVRKRVAKRAESVLRNRQEGKDGEGASGYGVLYEGQGADRGIIGEF